MLTATQRALMTTYTFYTHKKTQVMGLSNINIKNEEYKAALFWGLALRRIRSRNKNVKQKGFHPLVESHVAEVLLKTHAANLDKREHKKCMLPLQ